MNSKSRSSIGQLSLTNISTSELIDEFDKLFTKYSELKGISEGKQQKIYELQRNLETAQNGESFLSNELDALEANQAKVIASIKEKHLTEVNDLRSRNSNLQKSLRCLEGEVDELRTDNEKLTESIKSLTVTTTTNLNTDHIISEYEDKILKIHNSHLDVISTVEKLKHNVAKNSDQLAQYEDTIECLKDKLLCVEENYHSKKYELDEKTQQLEAAEEKIFELTTELSAYTSDPTQINKKGNSLFAEVDDQRQQMIQRLLAQKVKYQEMKNKFNECQFEIRRLKRQNTEIHKELQICSHMFLNADKTYKDRLNERVFQLRTYSDELERKVSILETKLVETAKNNGINWLDSIFAYSSNETKLLKDELHKCLIQKSEIEASLVNFQQETAKWRLEALTSRCTIIDREILLEENNISFDSTKNRIEIDFEDDFLPEIDVKAHKTYERTNKQDTYVWSKEPKYKYPGNYSNEDSFQFTTSKSPSQPNEYTKSYDQLFKINNSVTLYFDNQIVATTPNTQDIRKFVDIHNSPEQNISTGRASIQGNSHERKDSNSKTTVKCISVKSKVPK